MDYWWCSICGDLDTPYQKNDAELCPTCSARGALSVSREKALVNYINNNIQPPKGLFPCADMTAVREQCPYTLPVHHVGGLGNHYDMAFSNSATVETKITQKKTPSTLSVIRRIPWKDTVQFLQGQVKSEMASAFLGECGKPMLRAWWETIGDPEILFEDYMKAMYDISRKYSKVNPAAAAWVERLRASKEEQKRVQKEWLAFETNWFSTNTPSIEGLTRVVDTVLREKNWWLCISSKYAVWIPGPTLVSLVFDRVKQKSKGGSTFLYSMTLNQDDENYTIPLELKFHWKNGGQGVQNLNFMLL